MPRIILALAALVLGAALFLLGLYGLAERASPLVSLLGLASLSYGGILVLARARSVAYRRPHVAVIALAASALALHLFEAIHLSEGGSWFLVVIVLWALVPHLLCLVLSSVPATHVAAIGGAGAALGFDALTFYKVFIDPTSSTAALAMLFMPLWNMLVFVPAATALVWLALRRRAQVQ